MLYVHDTSGPLDTTIDVDCQQEEEVALLAEGFPDAIYFEFVPPPTIRDEALRFAREFIDTISDETQAVDLAWSDMIGNVESLFNPAMKRRA